MPCPNRIGFTCFGKKRHICRVKLFCKERREINLVIRLRKSLVKDVEGEIRGLGVGA